MDDQETRHVYAAVALHGLLASGSVADWPAKTVAFTAREIADALVAELKRTSADPDPEKE